MEEVTPDHINRRTPYLVKQMHGIALPKSAKHALELDLVNGDTRWRDAMAKEMALVK